MGCARWRCRRGQQLPAGGSEIHREASDRGGFGLVRAGEDRRNRRGRQTNPRRINGALRLCRY